MYSVVVKNLKTNKKATLTIDAITGNTKSHIQKSSPKTKKLSKKPVDSSVKKEKLGNKKIKNEPAIK